ncbi:MAG: hypothetical protein KDN18_17750 [Verrucomicrobiae bacterium]|nr:hypothetical protein [Verrucomicrobiae bacterium]
MKLFLIVGHFCFLMIIGTAILNGDEPESLPEFTLTEQDRDRLALLGDNFSAEMANSQTAEARKSAIIDFWENNVLAPPNAQTEAECHAGIETTVTALRLSKRPIFYAVRDGTAAEINNIQEREAVFAKSVAYMALITDPEMLGREIPALLESRKARSSFSRDDHFAVLVIRDLASQCQPVESLSAQELMNWKGLANATNAACRLGAVTAIGRVTSAVSDRVAVFSEAADETESPILSVIIAESSVLPPDDRSAFLENLRDNNSAITADQVAQINSILE